MEPVHNTHPCDAKQKTYFKPFLYEESKEDGAMRGKETSMVGDASRGADLCPPSEKPLQCLIPGGCMTPTQIGTLMTSEVKTPDANMVERSIFASGQGLDQVEYEVKLINYDDYRSTNHLLKHYLSEGQRTTALEHFGAVDIKEAAKLISKMGQREMQQKFKLVYGTTTHSNNNDWLRKKLYEAIGAAPAKQNVKSNAKKSHARGKKPKPKLPCGVIPEKQRRPRKVSSKLLDSYPVYPAGLPRTPVLKNCVSRSKSLPSTSPFGNSVIDTHAYIAMDYFSTSDEDMVSGIMSPEADFGSRAHNNTDISDQTAMGSEWRKSSFDSSESLEFSSLHSMPILFAEGITDWDIIEADRRKSIMINDKKQVEHQDTIMTIDEEEDILLPVDYSAFSMVDMLKDFL